jgi:dephospho-CoA kinase
MNIPVIVMGDRIRQAVRDAGLKPNDNNFGATANRLRSDGGMDAIARLCVPEIEKQDAALVLVDGIRGDTEVALFRNHFPGFVLISIDSSFTNRLARIAARTRSDDFTSADALKNRDERELGWGLGNALKGSDIHVQNDGTLDEFSGKVRELLAQLGNSP